MKKLVNRLIHLLNCAAAKYFYARRATQIYHRIFEQNISISRAQKIKEEIIKLDQKLSVIQKDLFHNNKKLHGKFIFEFMPTIKLAQKVGAHFITLIEDEALRFDAKIQFKNGVEKKVEWVSAIDHYIDSIRIEHCEKYGRAPVYGDIIDDEHIGTKNFRDINEVESTSYSTTEVKKMLGRMAIIIKENFDKKLEKQKNGAYSNMVLGIIIDDCSFPQTEMLLGTLNEVVSDIKKIPNEFLEIYLVGNKNIFIRIK